MVTDDVRLLLYDREIRILKNDVERLIMLLERRGFKESTSVHDLVDKPALTNCLFRAGITTMEGLLTINFDKQSIPGIGTKRQQEIQEALEVYKANYIKSNNINVTNNL